MSLPSTSPPALCARALRCFTNAPARIEPFGRGLINHTFRVVLDDAGETYVLQRVNPLFAPAIHENIRAVTEHLAASGLVTPRLLATTTGRSYADLGTDGIWRLMSYIPGATFDIAIDTAQIHAAGRLIGRVHAALDRLQHRFVGLRTGVHDTGRHLATLGDAVAAQRAHRLYSQVAPLADEIFRAAASLPPLPPLAPRICHGDLKLNNIRFGGATAPCCHEALCLVDLDTVGPLALAYELGDAWRSWCNPAGEDARDGFFDLAIFEASLAGYGAGLGRSLDEAERQALLHGLEWVSLELAARFAADALREQYFGWDATRFPGCGEHNLLRALGQWSLYTAVMATRPQRGRLLGL